MCSSSRQAKTIVLPYPRLQAQTLPPGDSVQKHRSALPVQEDSRFRRRHNCPGREITPDAGARELPCIPREPFALLYHMMPVVQNVTGYTVEASWAPL